MSRWDYGKGLLVLQVHIKSSPLVQSRVNSEK